MTDTALENTARALADKYGELGKNAALRLREWVSGDLPYTHPEALLEHCRQGKVDLLFDAFWQLLPFGTGGRRGRVGYGANRVNHTTVAMTIQGHCEYLRRAYPDRKDLTVVVANDVRQFNDIAGTYAPPAVHEPITAEICGISCADITAWL